MNVIREKFLSVSFFIQMLDGIKKEKRDEVPESI